MTAQMQRLDRERELAAPDLPLSPGRGQWDEWQQLAICAPAGRRWESSYGGQIDRLRQSASGEISPHQH